MEKEDKEDKKKEDDQRPAGLLSSQLLLKRSVYEVSLHPGVLTWTRAHLPSRLGHTVPVSEVISVRELEVASSTSISPCSCTSMCSTTTSSDSSPSRNSTTGTSMCTSRCTSGARSSRRWQKIPQRDDEDSPHAFTVSYVQRARRAAWRLRDVTFLCADAALCGRWVRTLTEQLSALAQRPRRLLVYINPLSGKRQGERIYRHKVAPLFSRANISTSVIVTQHANHARDHLRTEAELQNYDGVVCVGGDGMFSEVMHGLVLRTQRDQGRDHHHPDQNLAQTGLRIGIIPAGSTDCICFATVGANDPVTSSLHIIVGDCQPMDVCSVHHGDAFLRYSVSLLGYGFYGDVLSDSEKRRWMGPARYDVSGVKKFLSHRYYEGTVSYLPASDVLGTPRDRAPCRTGCVVCQYNRLLEEEKEEKLKMEESHEGLAWRSVRGKFLAINAVSMSCACPRSPQGLSPAAHLADGTTDLILVRKASRLAFLRHLLRHTSKDDQFDLGFVEVHRVRRFRFTPRFCQSDSELDLQELLQEKEQKEAQQKEVQQKEAQQKEVQQKEAQQKEAQQKEAQQKEVAGSQARRILGQLCREHPACCRTPPCSSCWNCDGEILPHADIQVRAHRQLIRLFARGIEETPVFDDNIPPGAI
ncbi:ceramide kinase-like [Gadus macrocephalus]|uniref:ceramide kinase-like n=1 Tax=Gadus macrocephalus TaxID=80720 RepID=UPI0028CB4A77|nr:ceramide kinase-like [Gadus macrocephalus]